MFEKNLEAIKQKNPGLAEKLEKIDVGSITGITVAEAENKDLIIGYKGIALHSTVDPIREARALWNKAIQTDLKKNDVQIVFGLGLGYLFKRAYLSANSKIFLVEPIIDILRFVLQNVDLAAELADERVYITDNVKDVADKLREEHLQGDRAEFLFLPAYGSLANGPLTELTTKVVKIIEEKSADINTILKFALHWTGNLILNLPYLFDCLPVGFLKEKFENKTALLISAGPGLAENIEKIRQNKDKFVTIAAGRAFKVLVQNGLIPDFVTFADAGAVKKQQIAGMEEYLEKTNVIVTSRTDHDVIKMNSKTKILYFPETDPFSELFKKFSDIDPGIYPSASSVSIINYFIAKLLGFKTIAFAGLDLAFPDNKIYATGEELKTDENGYIVMEMPSPGRTVKYTRDKSGRTIATRDDYLLFIRQFEDILEDDMSLSRVINTSMQGAYIEGMDYIDFDKLLEDLPDSKIDVDEAIKNTLSIANEKWNRTIRKVFDKFHEQIPEITEIKQDADELLNIIQAALEKLEKDETVNPADKEYTELRHKLITARRRVMNNLILPNPLQGELWNYTKNYNTENILDKEVAIHNLRVEKQLFEKVFAYSGRVLRSLEKAGENIKNTTTKIL